MLGGVVQFGTFDKINYYLYNIRNVSKERKTRICLVFRTCFLSVSPITNTIDEMKRKKIISNRW